MSQAAAAIRDRLVQELKAAKRVLWLVSGGSHIQVNVEIMDAIPDELTSNLTVYLIDERYGEVEHPDSNGKQLEDAGFNHKQARVVYTLAPGLSLEETTEQYALSIGAAFEAADVVIAQIGMGADGHIFGILPGSPAVDSEKLVVSYATEQYKRITLTAKAARQYFSVAYLFAFGESKRQQLEKLRDTDVSVAEQPAQLLKHFPEVYVYNDQLDD